MFKVNTQNLTAERGNAPKEMRGLGVESLRNLQTVLTTQQLIATANDAFDYKTHFNRGSEFISALAPALGMTDLDVDNLFLAASLID